METASYGEAFEAEKEWLVVEIFLDEHHLSEAFLIIWDAASNRAYVPVGHLSKLLELAIRADVEAAQIEGWIMDPERVVAIDLAGGRGEASGRAVRLSAQDWIAQPDDLYVAADVIAEWLPVTLNTELNRLRLQVVADEPLPIHRRLEREKRLARMRAVQGWDGAPHYEVLEAPYRFLGLPVMDLFLSGTLRAGPTEPGAATVPQSNAYNVRGAGDLLWMQGSWSFSGSPTQPLNSARLNLSRRDPAGRLLGAVGATRVELGDVHASAIPLVATGRAGRGVTLSTAPLTRAQTFDRTTLRGQLDPGWEVELYRNGAFLGTQSEANGRFEFSEVPLVYGWNELRMVFFGPYGQEREETERIFIGSEMVPTGEGQLDLQVVEAGTPLVVTSPDFQNTTGGLRATASYEFGLSSNLSVLGRATTTSHHNDETRTYLSAGARAGLGSWYVGGEVVADPRNGAAGILQFQTRKLGLNLSGYHLRAFGDFRSTALGYGSAARRAETNLRVDGALKFGVHIPYQLQWNLRDQRNDLQQHRISARYGLRIFGTQLSHSHQLDVTRGELQSLNARATLRRRMGDWSPHLSADYRIVPAPRLRSVQAGVDRKITRKLRASASVDLRNLVDVQLGVRAGIQGELSGVRWGLNAGWGQRGGWALGASLAMGLGPDPVDGGLMVSTPDQTTRGQVVAEIFRDANGNGERDPGEDPIEGASVRGFGNRAYPTQTNTSGRLSVAGNPSTYTELRLDTGSLNDPFAVSTVQGRSVITRPGTPARMKLPVVIAGEVDGTLFVERGGQHLPLPGGCVTLRPRQQPNRPTLKALETRTAYDGFFYFPHVPPGSYELGVCRSQSPDPTIRRPAPQPIFVGLNGTVVTGRQIVIRPPAAPHSPSPRNRVAASEVDAATLLDLNEGTPEARAQNRLAVEAERRALLRARAADGNFRVRIDGDPTVQDD
ncbi:hypothetical protein FRC98_18435 [Lujinxingia vulgaris]|uniref:Carboxypeptidase regulatory-like domain-containing protein n=1 Tax=Lujinxingia vulgaris TaxID=2600176 RepID=A0A5C6WY64_9DELT|nr:hypothetical protein [Lujinxingia vulgaris]TXD34392.1 hypothetical protein FRC98_18435 [Lujinxingia vulgaris]